MYINGDRFNRHLADYNAGNKPMFALDLDSGAIKLDVMMPSINLSISSCSDNPFILKTC
jgi:hypothetical protein